MDAAGSVGRDAIEQDVIVDAAIDIIVRNGLAGLTLRPLAASLGVSVAAVSARMGTKEQLVDRVVDVAAQREQRFFDRWASFAVQVAPSDAAARAALADLAFRDWMTTTRRQAILLIEVVHHHALHEAPSRTVERWLAQAGVFWSTLVFGSAALADLALGYVLDEAGFALGAGDDSAYVLLRVLCLQRFADGLRPRGDTSGAAIERLIAMLEPDGLAVTAVDDPKRQRIADSAARIIVSQGMNAATHRSVALAAEVPASTVVYHFGGRDALVVAGLHAVIARFHGTRKRAAGTAPGDDTEARDLVKATSMIALASVREPSLQPFALDMRRRRGENIRATDLASLGFGPHADGGFGPHADGGFGPHADGGFGPHADGGFGPHADGGFGPHADGGFDRATAQVISIALFGMRMVAMSRKLPEQACYRAAFAALDAWSDERTR